MDRFGNIYLADAGNSLIRKITPAGVVTTLAGLPQVAGMEDGVGSNTLFALFSHPQSICLDAEENIYVADTGNGAIRKITPAGLVSTLPLSLAPAGGGTTGNPGGGGSGNPGGGTTSPGTTDNPPANPPGSSGGGGLESRFVGVLGLIYFFKALTRRPFPENRVTRPAARTRGPAPAASKLAGAPTPYPSIRAQRLQRIKLRRATGG